jgi:hypothetical protein
MPENIGEGTRRLVFHAVVQWVADKTKRRPEDIDVSKKFSEPPYRMTKGAFDSMCKDVSTSLSVQSGRALVLSRQWVMDHRDDIIGVFINKVARELLAAPMNKLGRVSLEWTME